MRNIQSDAKKTNPILLLELLPFLLRQLMLLFAAAAAFLYLERGFGVGGRSFSASSSPTASNALQQKVLV